MTSKPPKGHRATVSLLKKIVKVPKADVDKVAKRKKK